MGNVLAAAIFLFSLGVPSVNVRVENARPDLWGVACHQDFRGRPGNAQHLCPTGFEGAIIYGFPSYDRALYLLAHETYHLNHTSFGTPDDPFREAEAHAYGCQFSEVC